MSELLAPIDDQDEIAPRPSRAAVPPIRPTDGERLMRFWRHRDQAALAEVIELHAGMVWGVCSHVLRRREDIEDAFQATFLILARKARSIRAADSAAGWLYRVAFRTALLARSRRHRLAETPLEYEPASSDDDQLEAIARSEQCRVLLEELHALPLQYRQPLVLCYLEGRSRSEAADELGVTQQSVKGRLARGTRMLRSRMAGRGVALSTTMAITTASIAAANAATPAALIPHTAALAGSFAWKLVGGGSKATAAKTAAATLAEKGILSMTLVAAAKPAVAVLGVCLAAGMFAIASADAPQGEGRPGAAVVLLTDAGSETRASAAADETAEVAISATNDESVTLLADDDAAAPDDSHSEDSDPFASVLGRERTSGRDVAMGTGAMGRGISEMGGRGGYMGREGTTAPEAPVPPADVLAPVRAPASAFFAESASPYAIQGGRIDFVAEQQAPQFRMQLGAESLPRLGSQSAKSLKLEQEYWDLKAKGLKLKAEAIQQKAQALEESGRGTLPEILELKAEAGLIEADLKLCEINSLRVQEQREAIEAGQLKRGAKGVQVRILQQQLNAMLKPSPKLEVDGDFGPLTEEAVKLVQKGNNVPVTGVVDEITATALGLGPQRMRSQPVVGAPIQPLPPTVEMNKPAAAVGGAGGGIFFREGQPASQKVYWSDAASPGEAVARAREAAPTQHEQRKARQSEVEALHQQIESLRHALETLQQQHEQAAEEAARKAEEN
ncbi:MAG TPA: sigma-70 family RNA polymerase sigma factor [Lacipirellula sp.]